MDKNAVMRFGEEHNGQIHEYPIGVLAENVQTDDEHQFVSKAWKDGVDKKIKNLENSAETFSDRLGDMKLEREGDTIYIVYGEGADAVRKKLGNEFVPYKSVSLDSTDHNQVRSITVDCTDIQGYEQYTQEDYLVVPTGVYEKNRGQESAHTLDRVSWDYNNGILTITNSVLHTKNESDSQQVDMWYSSFDIYAR